MTRLLVANWKLNPQTFREAEALAGAVSKAARNVKQVKVVLCPPFVWLTDLSHKRSRWIHYGAQDVFWEKRGAYTGEISPVMLKNAKVEYVMVGHSERRALGETDEMINKKIRAAVQAGLKVILCVGEPMHVRKKGLQAAKNFVKNQLQKDLQGMSEVKGQKSKVVIAYEPIWAIGTGKPDNPKETAEMAKFIKNFLQTTHYSPQTKVLYGGSVTSKNISRIIMHNEIEGVLVGGASLKSKEFRKIIEIVSKR